MCNPLMIAGAVAMAGSMVAKNAASNKVQKARDNAINAETGRQTGYDAEAAKINDTSRQRFQDFTGQQDSKSSDLASYFTKQSADVTGANEKAAASPTANNLVVRETQKQLASTDAFGKQQDTALGNLRSFGDVLGGISRDQATDAAGVQQIGNFKAGSSNVLPFELEDANTKGKGLKMFGDMLGIAGTALTMGGGAAASGAYTGLGSSWGSLFGSGAYGSQGALGYIPTSSGGVGGVGSGFGIGGV